MGGLFTGMGPRVTQTAVMSAVFFSLFEFWKAQLKGCVPPLPTHGGALTFFFGYYVLLANTCYGTFEAPVHCCDLLFYSPPLHLPSQVFLLRVAELTGFALSSSWLLM